jgi:hypothetical protein
MAGRIDSYPVPERLSQLETDLCRVQGYVKMGNCDMAEQFLKDALMDLRNIIKTVKGK